MHVRAVIMTVQLNNHDCVHVHAKIKTFTDVARIYICTYVQYGSLFGMECICILEKIKNAYVYVACECFNNII